MIGVSERGQWRTGELVKGFNEKIEAEGGKEVLPANQNRRKKYW